MSRIPEFDQNMTPPKKREEKNPPPVACAKVRGLEEA